MIGLDPTLLTVGPFAVRWSGLLGLLGVALGLWAALRAAARAGVPSAAVLGAAAWALPAGVLGARAVYVAGHWDHFLVHADQVARTDIAGLSLWGGIAGSGLALARYTRRDPILRARLADAAVVALGLAVAVASLGAVLGGEGAGTPSGLPWAVRYTHPLSASPDLGVARHPLAAYDGLAALALAAVAWRLPPASPPGLRAWLFVGLFAAWRLATAGARLEPAFLIGRSADDLVAGVAGLLAVANLARLGLRARRHPAGRPIMSPLPMTGAPVPTVILYGKPDCHLCEEAELLLARLRRQHPHQLRKVDVSASADLQARYGLRIPVIEVGGREWDAPLDERLLRRALADGA